MIEESELRTRLDAEAHSVVAWSNGPGTVYAAHRHRYRKILYCVAGSIRFDLVATGESIELHPGDRLDLAPDTAHSALVGPAGVSCLEGQARAG